MKGHTCFKGGHNCPHLHPLYTQAHITTTDTNITETEDKTSVIILTNHAEVYFTYYATSNIPTYMITDHLNITTEQTPNEML